MKVLQINSVCGIGSTGRIATDIHNILIEQGHESYIAYGRDLPKSCDNAIRIGTKIDIYSHLIKTRLLDKHGFGSRHSTKKLIKRISELNPDIIHLHNIHGYYINIEILFNYLKSVNIPIIWTMHDLWPITGHGAYLDNSSDFAGEDIFIFGTHKHSYPKSYRDNSEQNYELKKEIFSGVENLTIVSPSKWLGELVQESFLNKYPVKVINNGIDLDTFRPNTGDFRKKYNLYGKFIILGVANVWDRRKGLKYFIELADKISEDEVIVLVGLSEKQINKIPKNIICIIKTNNIEELVEIYSSADVFVNTTLDEVLGMTNIEALACGTPVITFDSGGSVETVDENTGFIVKKRNLEDLIKKLRVIKQKEKISFSEQCILRANHFYNKNERYKVYLNLYAEVLE